MISIKNGTQTYSDSIQVSSLKGSNDNTANAAEMKKHFGDKEIGEVLNSVADPNWVDPSKKMRTVGNDQLGKDAFMKLLLTQMKNQDPTSPMESHEMAAQLAQFSSLEQLANINTSIDGLKKSQEPGHNYDALKMIGQSVSGDSSKIVRSDLADTHDIRFDLASDAKEVKLRIKDAEGNLIRELESFDVKKGSNEVSWNGQTSDGSKARQGDYRVEIEAKSAAGKKLHAETKFEGKITGINFSSQGPVLMMGNTTVRLSDIKRIVDPNSIQEDKGGVRKLEAKATNNEKEIDQAPEKGNMDGIAMSRGLINEVKKSGVETKAY